MSDLDSKNSSGSEMNSSVKAKDDSLDLMQQMIKEQQQHLVSDYQYQYDMNNISVEKGECYLCVSASMELRGLT